MSALVFFTVANIAAIYAATCWARYWNQDGPLDRTIVYATLNWLLIVHSAMLGCGVLGLLRPEWVTGVVAVTAVVIGLTTRRAGRAEAGEVRERVNVRPIEYVMAACTIAAAVVWLKFVLLDPVDTITYDDQTYKALYPTLWLRDGQISLKTVFGVKAYYPYSAELVAFWFALPWRGESSGGLAWINLVAPVYLLLFAGCTAWLFRAFSASRESWMVPVLLLLASKHVLQKSRVVADNDLGLGVLIFAAFCLAATAHDFQSSSRRNVFYSSVAGCLAIGIRPTALSAVLIVFVLGAAAFARRRDWKGVATATLIWVGTGAATSAYWYVRNLMLTGNPVFPATVAGLPGLTTFPFSRITEFAAGYGWPTTFRSVIKSYADIPFFHGIVGYVGLLLACSAVFIPSLFRRGKSQVLRPWLVAVLVLVLVTLITYPFQPFSSGNYVDFGRGAFPRLGRYLYGLAFLGWAGAVMILSLSRLPDWVKQIAFVATAAGCFYYGYSPIKMTLLAMIVATAAVLGDRLKLPWFDRRLFVVGAALLIPAIAVLHPNKYSATYDNQTAGVFHVLEQQPARSRLWAYSPMGNTWILSLYGGNYQFQPVQLDENGVPSERLEPEADIFGRMPPPPTVTAEEFAKNLRENQISFVLTFQIPQKEGARWPAQHDLLAAANGAVLLAADDKFALWKIEE